MYNATIRHNAPTDRLDMEQLLAECRARSSQLFEQVEVTHDDTSLYIQASGPRRPDIVAFDVLNGNLSPTSHVTAALTQCAMAHDVEISFDSIESVEIGEEQYDASAEFLVRGRDLTTSYVKNIRVNEHGRTVYSAQDLDLSDMQAMLQMGRDILVAVRSPQSYLDALDAVLGAQYAPAVTH